MYIWMSIYIVGVQSPTGVKSIHWEGAKRGREKREEREAEKGEKRWGEIDIMEHEQWYFRGTYFVNLQPSRSTRSTCPSRVQWFCWGGLESFKQQHIKSQIFQKRTPRTTNIYMSVTKGYVCSTLMPRMQDTIEWARQNIGRVDFYNNSFWIPLPIVIWSHMPIGI